MGSFGSNKSKTRSRSNSSVDTFIDPTQQRFLSGLYGDARTALNYSYGSIADQGIPRANELYGAGSGLIDMLTGYGATGPSVPSEGLLNVGGSELGREILSRLGNGGPGYDSALDILQSGGGGDYSLPAASVIEQLLASGPAVDDSLSALSEAIAANTERQRGALGIESSMVGGTGGTREGVAMGLIGQEATRAFNTGATEILRGDLEQRRGLAPYVQGLLDDRVNQAENRRLAATDMLNNIRSGDTSQLSQLLNLDVIGQSTAGELLRGGFDSRVAAAREAYAGLGDLFNLGMAPSTMFFNPLLFAREVIGDPTTLNRARSEARGKSSAGGFNLSILGG